MNNALTLLGLLRREPSYGYDLKHAYDRYFGSQKPLAFGQVYSTLARMIRDELIRALGEEPGAGPDRKKYEITPAGQQRVEQWLHTPDVPSPTLQSELFAKTVIALLVLMLLRLARGLAPPAPDVSPESDGAAGQHAGWGHPALPACATGNQGGVAGASA